jgi:signal transduction histidine kinase
VKLGGDVAIEVSRRLREPLDALRDRLGLVVDHLERYVATSTGPTPYPWRSLQALRQDIAEAYLEVTHIARRVGELDTALADDQPHAFDLASTVELGLRLAEYHVSGGAVELLIDLGTAPPARGVPGEVALLVAQLVAASARSARGAAGSSLSVRVSSEDAWAIITIADNGGGDAGAAELGELARAVVAPWGGTADATSAEGQGCTFELRLVVA